MNSCGQAMPSKIGVALLGWCEMTETTQPNWKGYVVEALKVAFARMLVFELECRIKLHE